ncbi:MAG: MarR family transcriptional regulator [Actinomycetales bacterium]|nr:MarR family transcriptional regulator [Actinomycetales bacterium]
MPSDASSHGSSGPSAPEHFASALTRLARPLTGAMEEIAERHGLTVAELAMLLALGEGTGLSHAQLARRIHVTPQAGHELAVALARRGLVARHMHPANRRVRVATLSADGARVLAACRVDLGELEARVARPLGERSRTIVADLGAIADHLRGAGFVEEGAAAAPSRSQVRAALAPVVPLRPVRTLVLGASGRAEADGAAPPR